MDSERKAYLRARQQLADARKELEALQHAHVEALRRQQDATSQITRELVYDLRTGSQNMFSPHQPVGPARAKCVLPECSQLAPIAAGVSGYCGMHNANLQRWLDAARDRRAS